MMNFFALATAFRSILGDVQSEDIWKSLELMGIFIVMVLIFLLIVVLNRFTKKKEE